MTHVGGGHANGWIQRLDTTEDLAGTWVAWRDRHPPRPGNHHGSIAKVESDTRLALGLVRAVASEAAIRKKGLHFATEIDRCGWQER